ncbi:MAG: Nif3-like dinuclear metal center hexameric protein [Clostridia bacterium]|nr:Nif3-like dinuclear metal center hexameric protein [Clostridia bacterium]
MLNNKEFFSVLDKFAPIEYSYKLIEKGDYDNSGILINTHDKIERVLFTLDLSNESVLKAKRLKCDTIVTHHPAIYTPLKNLSIEKDTQSVVLAIENKLNVISMHLNLDIADCGIDASLCSVLGGEKYQILDTIKEGIGYGREFDIKSKTLTQVKQDVRKAIKSRRVISYGKNNGVIKKVASFCGGGANYAFNYVLEDKVKADLIITSDMPHHVIKALVEKGKSIILIPHYSAETVGLRNYYERIKNEVKNKLECFYFEDKRFM